MIFELFFLSFQKDDSKTKNPIKIVLTSDGPSEKKKHLKTSSDGKAKFKIAKRSSEERNLEDSSLPCKSLIELMEHNPQISGSMFEVTCVAFNDSTFELSITHWSSPEIEMSRKSYFPRLLLALESLLDGFYKTFEVRELFFSLLFLSFFLSVLFEFFSLLVIGIHNFLFFLGLTIDRLSSLLYFVFVFFWKSKEIRV